MVFIFFLTIEMINTYVLFFLFTSEFTIIREIKNGKKTMVIIS